MSRFSDLIDQLDDLNQQDIKNTARLLGVTAVLYERLQNIANRQEVSTAELPEGQAITKDLLEKRFGSFQSTKNAYGIKARSWDDLVNKVQNLPIPSSPLSLEDRVQYLEEGIQVLSDVLLELIKKREPKKEINTITSYEEFKEVVLETYDRLNYEYNYNNLVPIYKIRRDIGDKVTRAQFKDWMLKIRIDKILSLYVCDNRTVTEDEIQDSIYDDNLGTRYFFAQKN